MNHDDLLQFVDETPPAAPLAAPASGALPRPWRVLVVDDDADVHEATRYALRGMLADGRGLELLHAHSAAEGLAMLRTAPDVAVALVDVVMETDDAGLQLVAQARQQLGLRNLRIILRTGQPGMAPEIETIERHDINDYRTKGELTRNRLHVSLLAALRSYDQLHRLDIGRAGLEKVIQASRSFLAETGMVSFAEGIILQLASLMGVEVQGLVCVRSHGQGTPPATLHLSPDVSVDYTVIAAAGPYSHLLNKRAMHIGATEVAGCLQQCLAERRNLLRHNGMALYFEGAHGHDTAAYVALPGPLDETRRSLLDVFCTNITMCADNIGLMERLRTSAHVDEQLGVANQLALCQRIDGLQSSGQASDQVLALVDIDQFAEINDMLGHQAGDQVLKDLAERLARAIGPQGLLARVGGNTFAVLGPESALRETLLRDAIAQPIGRGDIRMPLSACLGWLHGRLLGPAEGSVWLKKAAIALKRAKSRGLGQSEVYRLELSDAAEQRTRLLEALHTAADSGELSLAYQPKIHLATGRVVGLEALMRWRRPDGSMVPPDSFIPVAEQSGLILPMGAWAMETALRALKTLQQDGHQGLHVAVNVTVSQFMQPDFVQRVLAALQTTGMAAADLELEVTESVALTGQTAVIDVLHTLRSLGISLAIDDFGTGFSSLSYLDQVPAHRLKIDRAFVQALDRCGRSPRIAGLIVPLGHQIGMTVVAEGVETLQQAQQLHELGCDEVQGYLFARPMPLVDLQAWLRQPNRVPLPWLAAA